MSSKRSHRVNGGIRSGFQSPPSAPSEGQFGIEIDTERKLVALVMQANGQQIAMPFPPDKAQLIAKRILERTFQLGAKPPDWYREPGGLILPPGVR